MFSIDISQMLELISNQGILAFLVIYNLIYGEKNRKEQTAVLIELRATIEHLNTQFMKEDK